VDKEATERLPLPSMLRTFRMVAEPGESPGAWVVDHDAPTIKGLVCIDVVLRGQPGDVDALSPMIKRWLDTGCLLLGSWVDEGTDRHVVTFGVAPTVNGERGAP